MPAARRMRSARRFCVHGGVLVESLERGVGAALQTDEELVEPRRDQLRDQLLVDVVDAALEAEADVEALCDQARQRERPLAPARAGSEEVGVHEVEATLARPRGQRRLDLGGHALGRARPPRGAAAVEGVDGAERARPVAAAAAGDVDLAQAAHLGSAPRERQPVEVGDERAGGREARPAAVAAHGQAGHRGESGGQVATAPRACRAKRGRHLDDRLLGLADDHRGHLRVPREQRRPRRRWGRSRRARSAADRAPPADRTAAPPRGGRPTSRTRGARREGRARSAAARATTSRRRQTAEVPLHHRDLVARPPRASRRRSRSSGSRTAARWPRRSCAPSSA